MVLTRQTVFTGKGIIFIFMCVLMFLIINQAVPFCKPILKFSDEILLMLSFLIIFFWTLYSLIKKLKLKLLGFIVCFVWLGYQIVNYLESPFNLKINLVLMQSLIHLKVFLTSIALILVFSNNFIERKLIKFIFYYILLVFIIGIIGNFLFKENWNILWRCPAQYRYGIIRPIGWFGQPAQNAYLVMLLLLFYFSQKSTNFVKSLKNFFKVITTALISMIILTVRKVLFIIIPISCFFYKNIKKIEFKLFYILLLLLFIFFLLSVLLHTPVWKDTIMNLESISPDTSYIRGFMLWNGIKLFFDFFPFGVGCATFGTVLSQYNTFEVYNYVGLNLDRFFYKYEHLTGVYDSGFASFLAENGFIGLLIFLLFLFLYFRFLEKRLSKKGYDFLKLLVFITLLLSLTEPVMQNGLYAVFYNILILKTKIRNEKI